MQIISLNIQNLPEFRIGPWILSSRLQTGYKSILRWGHHVSLVISKSGAVNVLEKLLLWCQLVRNNFNGKPYLKWFE